MLAQRILRVNMAQLNDGNSELIVDIRLLVQADRSRGPYINFYCAYELARKGRIDRAIAFLDSLTDEQECRQCCTKILNIVVDLLDRSSDTQQSADDHLFELLKYVDERLSSFGGDDLTQQTHRQFVNINRMLMLRRHFDISLNLAALNDADALAEYQLAGVHFVLDNFSDGQDSATIVQSAWHSMQQLAEALEMDRLSCLVQLLIMAGCLEFSCIMAKMVLQLLEVNAANWKNCVLLADMLFVQQMHEHQGNYYER